MTLELSLRTSQLGARRLKLQLSDVLWWLHHGTFGRGSLERWNVWKLEKSLEKNQRHFVELLIVTHS